MISGRPSWLQEFGVIGSSVDINVSTCRFNAHVQRKGGVQGICAMRKALSEHERDGAQLRERRLEDYFRQQNERIAELERRLGQAAGRERKWRSHGRHYQQTLANCSPHLRPKCTPRERADLLERTLDAWRKRAAQRLAAAGQ